MIPAVCKHVNSSVFRCMKLVRKSAFHYMIMRMMNKLTKIVTLLVVCISSSVLHTTEIHADNEILSGTVSDYAYVIDYDNGQVLADLNADQQMYPASMTKLMTTMLAIENLPDLDQTVTITSEMLNGLYEMDASVAGFQVDDTPTVRDLLYGCALPSGADAANALAITVGGSIDNYVSMMNAKAEQLGMTGTHFTNVTGLHDPDHYSTAKDIAALLTYCLQNDTFREVFSAQYYTTSALASSPDGLTVYSTVFSAAASNGYDITGMIGAKSGYTNAAGHCLASWDSVNGMNLIIVTAHAATDISDASHVADLASILSSLQGMERVEAAAEGAVIQSITLHSYFGQSTYDVCLPEAIHLDTPKNAEVSCSTDLPADIELTNDDQDIPYHLSISVNGAACMEETLVCHISKDGNFFTRILRNIVNLFK